jgi:hypothetical protein
MIKNENDTKKNLENLINPQSEVMTFEEMKLLFPFASMP